MTVALLSLAFLSSYTAWALAALSRRAHWESIRMFAGRRAPPAHVMQALACICAALSATACVVRDGWAFGLLLWACQGCVAAVSVVLTLAWFDARDGFRTGR